MKTLLTLCLLLLVVGCGRQTANDLYPTLGKLIDMSEEGERDFQRRKYNGPGEFPDGKENYWDIGGVGCSYYCAGYRVAPKATSELLSNGKESYIAWHLHDDSYRTAWIEGVDGYGEGETVTYVFPPDQPAITDVIVLNGYLKSDACWHEYSRVKTLNMYVSDTLYAVLHLEDSKYEQVFKVGPIGHTDRSDKEELAKKPEVRVRFELADHYPGDKYDATALTEIYFDGVHAH